MIDKCFERIKILFEKVLIINTFLILWQGKKSEPKVYSNHF